ncbi:hypothetical protein V866_003900 [Kwoniella sp. B9012]
MSTSSQGTFYHNLTQDDNGTRIGTDNITLGGVNYTLKDSVSVGREVLFDDTNTNQGDIVTILRTQQGCTKYVYGPTSYWSSFYGQP